MVLEIWVKNSLFYTPDLSNGQEFSFSLKFSQIFFLTENKPSRQLPIIVEPC